MEGDAVVDEDGDIFVVVNGKPAQGKLVEAEEMPIIMFSAEQDGPHQIKNADMSSAPTIMMAYDSNGTEVGRNLQGENFETLRDFLDCDLKQGQLYILVAVPFGDENQGKPFSISVKTADQEMAPEVVKESKPAETMIGPVKLEQGVDVGLRGVSYSVKRDEQGRIMRLDDASANGFLIEYRRGNETPGLDVWRKDGTYSWYYDPCSET